MRFRVRRKQRSLQHRHRQSSRRAFRSAAGSGLRFERLEKRELLDGAWHNELRARDVNHDGSVTPLDALSVINALVAGTLTESDGRLPPLSGDRRPPPFVDVNDDGFLSPVDALVVVNAFNMDQTGPVLEADFANDGPSNASLFYEPPIVEGTVDDEMTSVTSLLISVDGGNKQPVPIGTGGRFRFDTGLLTDENFGEGQHRVEVVSRDIVGNETRAAPLLFTLDRTRPSVVWSIPDGETDVFPRPWIHARFSEPITIVGATAGQTEFSGTGLIELRAPDQTVSGTVVLGDSENELWFFPNEDLRGGREFQFSVGDRIRDLAGNIVESDDVRFATRSRVPRIDNDILGSAYGFPDGGRVVAVNAPEVAPGTFGSVSGFAIGDVPTGPILLEFQAPMAGGDEGAFSRTGVFYWYDPENNSPPFLWASPDSFPAVDYTRVNEDRPTVIELGSQLPGWSLVIPPDSIRLVRGGESDQVRMLKVPNHLVPANGLVIAESNSIVFVDVAGGDAVFLEPVEIAAPNDADFPAGEKLYLWAFDPTRGKWDAVSEAAVSQDGKLVRTLAGQGANYTGLYTFLPQRQARITLDAGLDEATTGRVFYRAQFDIGGQAKGWIDSGTEFDLIIPPMAQIAVIEVGDPILGLYGRHIWPIPARRSPELSGLVLEPVVPLNEGTFSLDSRIADLLGEFGLPLDHLLDRRWDFDPWGGGLSLKKPATLDVEVKDLAPGDGFVFVASGDSGLQVVDVSRPAEPVLVSRTELSSAALEIVARSSRVAVVLESGDVEVFDVSDPRSPLSVASFKGRQASHAALHGNVLIITTGTSVATYNILTGTLIDEVKVGWATAIDDVKVVGQMLHVLLRSNVGYTIESYWVDGAETIGPGFLRQASEASFDGISPFELASRRGTITADDNEILVADSVGFPPSPLPYQPFQPGTPWGDWSAVAAMLSDPAQAIAQDGTGVAAFASPRWHYVRFQESALAFDLTNGSPNQSQPLITSPEELSGIALAQGIAYAGSTLTVAPYSEYKPAIIDLLQPPTTSVIGTSWANQQISASIHVRRQSVGEIHQVDVLFEGNVVATDTSVPFDLDIFLSDVPPDRREFDVTVRVVSDNGDVENKPVRFSVDGRPEPNSTDDDAPTITDTQPSPASLHWEVDEIALRFNESLNTEQFSLAGATVIEAGADGDFGTTDDVPQTISGFAFAWTNTLRLSTAGQLAPGNYRVTLGRGAIEDVAGNVNTDATSFEFTVAGLLDATAITGTPFFSDQASANTSQSIVVQFPGAGDSTRVIFPIRNQEGRLSKLEVSPYLSQPNQAFFRVPMNATTGKIEVRGVDRNLYFQIVPTLSSVSGSRQWQLRGSGFVERAMQVKIGGAVAQEFEPVYALDGLGRILNEVVVTPANDLTTSGPLTVTTSGGTSNPFGFPGKLVQVEALANTGVPANSDLSSANPGQVIRIHGEGFTSETLVHFPVVQTDGQASRQLVRPIAINEAGTELTVEVPYGAETGFIGLVSSETQPGLWLQIVPVLTSVRGDRYSVTTNDSRPRVEVHGTLLPNRTKYHFGSATVIDDADFENRDVEFRYDENVALVRLPIDQDLSGAITVETAGGTSAPLRVTFDHLESMAIAGTPANPLLPSANAGQAVVLHGSHFDMQTVVIVDYRLDDGQPAASVLTNVSVSPDGTKLVGTLPKHVNGAYPLRVLGAETSQVLQIVPVLDRLVPGTRLDGSGFLEGNGSTYTVDDLTVTDDSISDSSIDVNRRWDGSYNDWNGSVALEAFAAFRGAVSVSTIGGTSNSLLADFFLPQIEGLVDITAGGTYGATSNQIFRIDANTGEANILWQLDREYISQGIQLVTDEFQLGESTITGDAFVILRNPQSCSWAPCPSSVVQAVDVATGAVIGELSLAQVIPSFNGFLDAVYHAEEKSLYVVSSHELYKVDAQSGQKTGQWVLPSYSIHAIEIDPQTQNLWIGGGIGSSQENRHNFFEVAPNGTTVRALDLPSMGGVSYISGLGVATDGQLWAIAGEVVQSIQLTPARPNTPHLDRIQASAFAGIPQSNQFASANVMQPVELVGSNFTAKTKVRFPARGTAGQTYFETVSPTVVSPDGTRMQVLVPRRAETGEVTLVAESELPHWALVNDTPYAVYRQIAVPFTSTEAVARLTFQQHGLTESWGLDNVRIVSAANPADVIADEDFESVAELHWKYPQTNFEGRGYLTQFLGPLTTRDQSLIVSVLSDQEYLLVFDYYALDPILEPLLPSVPGYTFSVSLNGQSIYRHSDGGLEPNEGELVQVPETGSVSLQIVPTIIEVADYSASDRGAQVVLYGTGFIEGDMQLAAGGIPWPEQFPDPSNVSESYYALKYFVDGSVSADTTNSPDRYTAHSSTSVFGPLTITTSGGTYTSSTRSDSVSIADFVGIDAVALRGEPTNPDVASANVGQVIRLQGTNLIYSTVVFEGVSDVGVPGEIAVLVTPSTTAGEINVIVPPGARTGVVRVMGDDETRIQLQIVPTLDAISVSGESALLEGSGFVVGETTIEGGAETFDVTQIRPSGRFAHVTEISVPAGLDADVLHVKTTGGRYSLVRTNPIPAAASLEGISAIAGSGEARWPNMPSAIVGQTITLRGQGFSDQVAAFFPSNDPQGAIEVLPLSVANDGTSLTIKVPTGAISGGVKLAGDSYGHFLQIVPTVEQFQWDESVEFGRMPAVIVGTGFVERANTLRVGGTRFSELNALGKWHESGERLRMPWPQDLAAGPLQIETLGGVSTPLSIGISRVESAAEEGSPANPQVASANAGQTITIHGHGLHAQSAIRFHSLATDLTVKPSRLVSDTQVEVVVPEFAESGYVSVVGDDRGGRHWLQIVPKIQRIWLETYDFYAGPQLILNGTGFGSSPPVAYTVGDTSGYILASKHPDTGVGYLSSNFLKVPLSGATLPTGPITVTTIGGTTTYTASMSGIQATANSGTARESTLPSANPEQTITITGASFSSETIVFFRFADSAGFPQWTSVAPSSVASDGMRLDVTVPRQANGIADVIVPGAAAHSLQVVPVIRGLEITSYGTTIRGLGLAEGDNTVYRLNGAQVIDEFPDGVPIDVYHEFFESYAKLSLPAFGAGGSLTIETSGGISAPMPLPFTYTGMTGLHAPAAENYVLADGQTIYQIDLQTGSSVATYSAAELGLPKITNLFLLVNGMPSFSGVPVPEGSLLVSSYDAQAERTELLILDPANRSVLNRKTIEYPSAGPFLGYDHSRQRILMEGSNSLLEVDPATWSKTVTSRFDSVNRSYAVVALHPVTGNLWVARSSTLTEYGENGEMLREITITKPVDGETVPSGLAFQPDGRALVTTYSGILYEIAIPNSEASSRSAAGFWSAYSPDDGDETALDDLLGDLVPG